MIRLLVVLLVLAGCGHRKPKPPVVAGEPNVCQIETLGGLTGRPGSAVLASEALAKSGARVVRWIRPDQVATMEFREDRLNIQLDDDDIVTHFTCG